MNDPNLELRKIELAEKEFDLKREDVSLRREQDNATSTLRSPLGIAAIGGVLTLLTALLGNLLQGFNDANVQRQEQQSALVLKAIDTKGDTDKARENLQFFVEAGLIEDNGRISRLVERARNGETVIPSVSSIIGPREQELRYYIEELPTVTGADAPELVSRALAAWQTVARIPGKQVETNEAANVVIVRAREPGAFAYAFLGPPTRNTKLEISLSHDAEWTAKSFQAAVCREFGHVLGLANTPTPGQLMSSNATADDLPVEPQPEDIQRVRELWNPNANTPE